MGTTFGVNRGATVWGESFSPNSSGNLVGVMKGDGMSEQFSIAIYSMSYAVVPISDYQVASSKGWRLHAKDKLD